MLSKRSLTIKDIIIYSRWRLRALREGLALLSPRSHLIRKHVWEWSEPMESFFYIRLCDVRLCD